MTVAKCTMLLHSIHNVLKAEKLLKNGKVHIDLIPVPRGLSSDCGMAIEFNYSDLKRVQDTLEEGGLDIAGIYLNEERKFKQIV
ncbi:MAG: DUF3343 domain-containing protein [Pseudomonadota bacterium]